MFMLKGSGQRQLVVRYNGIIIATYAGDGGVTHAAV